MARQPRFISCGYRMAIIATVIKFLVGPLIMAGASLAVGLRGTLLRVAIVQVNKAQNTSANLLPKI